MWITDKESFSRFVREKALSKKKLFDFCHQSALNLFSEES
jgi:hypothetical protein